MNCNYYVNGDYKCDIVEKFGIKVPNNNGEKWEEVNDKVCYGKYISPNRVGYGQLADKNNHDAVRKWCQENPACQAYYEEPPYGYYYYTGLDLKYHKMDDNNPNQITDDNKGVCTKDKAKTHNGAKLYIKKSKKNMNIKWDKIPNKVCYGKYISPNRVGYGQLEDKNNHDAVRKWCQENPACQAYYEEPPYGYYYYTGLDLKYHRMDDNNPNKITDDNKGFCTKEKAKTHNGATLYIKKYEEESETPVNCEGSWSAWSKCKRR